MRKAINWFIRVSLIAGFFSYSAAQAATITASSYSQTDVSTAISSASNGDVVVIPNGLCTCTTGISTSKQLTIIGQTKGSVLLTHSATTALFCSISQQGRA